MVLGNSVGSRWNIERCKFQTKSALKTVTSGRVPSSADRVPFAMFIGNVRNENPVDPKENQLEESGYRTRLHREAGLAVLFELMSTTTWR